MTTEKTEQQIPAADTSTKEETKTTGNDKFLQQEPTAENEIHVAAKGHIKNYLGYAFRILNKTNHQQLKIRATGNAIVKANILIELVKRRVGDLHQLNSIYSMVISSHEEKLGEKIETKRRVTAMDTLLSKSALDTNDPGYQEPTPKDEPYQGASRPGGQSRMKNKDDKRRRGPKLYNAPRGGDGDDDKKDQQRGPDDQSFRGRQQADKYKRNNRSRRDRINAPGVKDDEQSQRRDRMDRSQRGGYNDHGYGGRNEGNRQYGDRPRFDRGGFNNHRGGGMPPYMQQPYPRSFDDFGVRPMRGSRGHRPRMPYNNDRRPMNDMGYNAGYGPPQYEQNYHGGYGGGGGYDNYYGPPPERRYPPRHGGEGGNMRYNDPRGPRQPYNSERYNNDSQGPAGRGGYRGDRSERPTGQGAGQMDDNQSQGRIMASERGGFNPDSRGKHPDGGRRTYNDHSDMPRDERGDREQERSERPRYNQPRDEGEPFRGHVQMRGNFENRGSYGGRGFRRGYDNNRGGMGFHGGPHRDNDRDGGGSRFNGGYDNFRGDGGPGTRGVRGTLRGGRGGRGGMLDRPEGQENFRGGPMHKISERREDGMGRRGMEPYRGRGQGEESGRPRIMDDRGGRERGGFNAPERGEAGIQNHVIKTKSRGGLGSSGPD